MPTIRVMGAGPAGSAAALAALHAGASVHLFETSHFPRHKVCGEFISPEVIPLLESLGVMGEFHAARPAVIRTLALHFRASEKVCPLPQPAFGLSRFAFDHLLLQKAMHLGAQLNPAETSETPLIIAHGRKAASTRGNRLFGFKAHFEGPVHDSIELFFFDRCYVGVSAVENGITNVCGLGPEDLLLRHRFDIDAVIHSSDKLAQRLSPLRRTMQWLKVGPLVFQNRFDAPAAGWQYAAGDALSFVDPFTGSGLSSAILSGRLAGMAAASRTPPHAYLSQCRKALERPFQIASLFRSLLANGWGARLAGIIPGRLLVSLTRPHSLLH